jgi:exonuclease III
LEPFLKNPFKDYNGYWNFCKIKPGYSGVAIFAREKPLKIVEDFEQSSQDSLEGRVICL